ncbi:MAG: cupin-like domain-containing protein [Candidatus Binatus sp.]
MSDMSQSTGHIPASIQRGLKAAASAYDTAVDAKGSGAVAISRRSDLSYDEFVREYRDPRVPVILTDAISEWPALSKWSPEFFKRYYSSTQVTIDGRYGNTEQGRHSLGDMIDAILRSTMSSPAPYLKNQNLIDVHPELRADMSPLPIYAFPNWLDGPFSGKLYDRFHRGEPELHIGGPGAVFPSMHHDYGLIHTFISQIYGQKKVKALSPAQSQFVYPKLGENHHGSRIPDIDHVDLEQFPLFAKAVLMTADLQPGDTLFVPAGWWHTTRMASVSITASFNFANASNWSDLSRECGYLVPIFPKLRFQTYLLFLRLFRSVLGH